MSKSPDFPNGVCYLADYGVRGDYLIGGSTNPNPTDNTSAWNAIVPFLYPGVTAVLPAGHCMFGGVISALPDGVKLIGSGSTSAMVRNFSSTAIFLLLGASYCTVEKVSFFTAHGTSGGIAVGHIATDWVNCSYRATLRDVVVTGFGNGTWEAGVRLDGLAGYPHYGTRAHVLDGVLIGAAVTFYGIMLAGCNGATMSNIIMAGGTWGLWLCGSADQPCGSNTAYGVMNSTVLTYSSHNLTVYGGAFGRILTDYASASNTFYANSVSQPPELYGANNHVYAGGEYYGPIG